MRALRAAFLLAITAAAVAQQAPAPATVTFQFDRKGLSVPHFTLVVREDGTGTYEADEVPTPPNSSVYGSAYAQASTAAPATQHIDRTITVSQTTAQKIFATAHTLNRFNIACASKAKNIADTGNKVLTYSGPGGSGSCTYNYSENKNVVMLTDLFQGIAFTMDQGRKLEYDHRYDRLGLDAEIASLMQSVEEKNALELGNIATTLSAIADDSALIQRVRLKAAKLLTQIAETH